MDTEYHLEVIILGGGRGERLFPLTQKRAKPAVPIGGKYRLVDIPISNCINSGIKNIHLLTQVNTASLHRHIFQTYKFDNFSNANIEILAAQQTLEQASWFQGTCDAVRSYWERFERLPATHFLILAGDHLYSMDYRHFFRRHLESEAEITVAAKPVPVSEANRFGIMQCDQHGIITRFVEKPQSAAELEGMQAGGEQSGLVLASLGIYIFKKDILERVLRLPGDDFGKDMIPAAATQFRTSRYRFDGYWEDIGTIKTFFDANLGMTDPHPNFSLYNVVNPIYTRPRYLPGTQIVGADISNSIVNEGCRIGRARIRRSIVGIRSVIGSRVSLEEAIVMGADYFEPAGREVTGVSLGIGDGSVLRRVILDKNVRIGRDVRLVNQDRLESADNEFCYIRNGIIVVPAGTVIPDGTRI